MFRLFPWRFLVKRAARRYGVLDPATLLARMRRFAQPSEVGEPMELLRAGIVFHARGLVNSKAIQHNLDWVWPYWVEKQFNPADPSFIPRAFSFSHINLTHRNWTAVGLPECDAYPIVDPRGLLTPLHDGWSLDFWIITESRRRLLPSKLPDEAVTQTMELEPELAVRTRCRQEDLELDLRTRMIREGDRASVVTQVIGHAAEAGWLAVAVRPYNPEGVQFIHRIASNASGTAFRINDEAEVELGERPATWRTSHYAEGDVYLGLPGDPGKPAVDCEVGMATAAALFKLEAGVARTLTLRIGLPEPIRAAEVAAEPTARLQIPDARMQFLYDAAVRTVLLLSAGELVPGPYTYRRFWFRDACLMLHPLLAIGLAKRAERILRSFPPRQTHGGYFQSQEGEWDSNGQVLWIAARFARMTGSPLPPALEEALRKAVRWLAKKRLPETAAEGIRGLLPAGFSAEHLGPNDYYYWDDFWAVGGLEAIAAHWTALGDLAAAEEARILGEAYRASIERSLAAASRAKGAIPAAPGRRMDAGAIGSMVADYPLQLFPPAEARLTRTLDYLLEHCFHGGGFFQQMIHSGINAYLTLDLAQTLLRAGDERFMELMRNVVRLASPTGQWPEAIHPQTLGGCMGDGQHGWAAAEWLMMIRNCFVREEDDELILGSGILPEWREAGSPLSFGPTLTAWGAVSVELTGEEIRLQASWRGEPPRIGVRVPGFVAVSAAATDFPLTLRRP